MAPSLLHDNPFPGIRSYEIHEDELFFGRELQVRELIEKLFQTRFLAIVGSSGCGKSSLIKAGVIPTLLKNKTKHFSTNWKVNIFRPSDDPIGNLALALSEGNAKAEIFAKQLRSGKEGLVNILTTLDNPAEQSRLIIIDQFEELFRFQKSRTAFHTIIETSAFVDLILTAISHTEIPIYIILSMRTDFLDECTEFRGLTETINRGYYLVPRMNNEERRLAITGPVEMKKCKITGELVEQLLKDVGDDPDQLPILQHAMMRTWDYWTLTRIGNQPIGLEHYTAIGTMKEALSFHLEEIFAELGEFKSKYIAEKLFKALTEINKESRGTRRPTQLSEIITLAEARQDEIIRVIDSFRKPGCAFLMPSANVELNADSTIDISHESIMRVWTRLKNWVEEESQSAQLYLRLSKSAELYQEGKTGLWINPELQLALQWKDQTKPNGTWAMRYDPAFDRAITFLQFSKKQNELELSKKENLQKRNLKRARTSAIILGIASLISILFLLISLNLRFKAEASRKEAIEKEKLAVFERKRMEEQRKEAILQKKISEQQQQIAEQQEMITEQQRQYAVKQQVIAQEQTTVAVFQKKKADESKQEALVARDEAQSQRKEAIAQKLIADKERIKAEESEKNTQRLRLLAISRTMAIQASQLYNTVKDDLPGLLAVESYKINKENGGLENDAVIYSALSEISNDQIILRGHEDGVRSIVLSKDGKTLYSCGDDDNLLMWKLNNPQLPPVHLDMPKQGAAALRCVGLTFDEGWLIAGSATGKLIIWNRNSVKDLPRIVQGHTAVVNELATHPSKNIFASAGSDGKLLIWKYEKEQFSKTLLDSVIGKVNCVSFNHDGTRLAYGTSSGIVKTISINGKPALPFVLMNSGNAVLSITFSKDGKSLAAGLSNGTIKVWDINDQAARPQEILGRHASGVTALTFSQDGGELASSSYDRTMTLAGFPSLEAKPISIKNHDLWVYDILFTPDDKQLISCSADKTIRIVSTENARMAEKLKQELKRNMTKEEWQKIVGGDIPYKKTRSDLP
ncbi:MAG: hypothetical protein WCK84_08430 [Bacteroidota bacterium]